MNPQPDQDLDEIKKQLEVEINSPPPSPLAIPQPEKPLQPQIDSEQSTKSQLNQFIHWFSSLSGFGKLIVVGVAAVLGLALLRTVLKLVAAVISLVVLAGILYLVYQFFLSRSTETKN